MIKIVTDSSSYLPPEVLQERDIEAAPLKVHFGETEVYDEITGISNADFYRRLSGGDVFPTTSQPSAGEFKEAYETQLAAGADHVLAITLSSRLSGTYNSAQMAASMMPDAPITVFDTFSVALGEGIMVLVASDMAQEGRSLAEILARLEQMRRDFKFLLLMDTLEYLYRGGRIGAASAWLGGVLKIKPLLAVDDGLIKPIDKIRTKRKGVTQLIAELDAALPDPNVPVQIGAMHVNALDEMNHLLEHAQSRFTDIRGIITGEVGPVVGAHTGPGVFGIGICPVPEL